MDEDGRGDEADELDELDTDQTLPEAVAPTTPQIGGQLSIIVVAGPEAGLWFRIPPEGCSIGRRDEAVVHLTDPAISRRHAAIERAEDDTFVLRDLGSRNGVFVQGVRVSHHRLADGDHIQLSAATLLRARFRGPVETGILDDLQRATATDPLTGIANRRYLMSRLEEELSFAWRHKVPVSVLLLDVDDLKTVNDLYGHRAGDVVLVAVAEQLKVNVRVEDVLGRHGGDEFVVISRGYPPEAAGEFARRLCETVQQTAVEVAAGQRLRISLRIGVAGCDDEQLQRERLDPMALLVRANAALIEAKRTKQRVATWAAPAAPPADDRRAARVTRPAMPAARKRDRDDDSSR